MDHIIRVHCHNCGDDYKTELPLFGDSSVVKHVTSGYCQRPKCEAARAAFFKSLVHQ